MNDMTRTYISTMLNDSELEITLIQAMSEPTAVFNELVHHAADKLLTAQYNTGIVSEAEYNGFIDKVMTAITYLQDQYLITGRELSIPIDVDLLEAMGEKMLQDIIQSIERAMQKVDKLREVN